MREGKEGKKGLTDVTADGRERIGSKGGSYARLAAEKKVHEYHRR
jgi:hypothetical protein